MTLSSNGSVFLSYLKITPVFLMLHWWYRWARFTLLTLWKKTRHNCKCYNDAFRCIFICTKDIRKIKSLFSRASAKKSQLLTWLLLKLKRDQQSNILYKIHHLQTVQNIGNILGFWLFVVVSIWGGKRHIK